MERKRDIFPLPFSATSIRVYGHSRGSLRKANRIHLSDALVMEAVDSLNSLSHSTQDFVGKTSSAQQIVLQRIRDAVREFDDLPPSSMVRKPSGR